MKPTKPSNSVRVHSTDQAKGTDVDAGDGEGQWAGSDTVEREHRGKGIDGVKPNASPARLPENQGQSKLSEQPSARHLSGDVDGWVGFADMGNRSNGNMHTVTDRACWPWLAEMERSGEQGDN